MTALTKDDFALAAVSAGMILEISVVGQLTGGDLACFLFLPLYLLSRGRTLSEQPIKLVVLSGLMWFASQGLTDLWQGTPFNDWTRGIAKISVFLINTCCLAMITRLRVDKSLLLIQMTALAGVIKLILGIGNFDMVSGDTGIAWKFGYGYFVGLVAFVIVWRLAGRRRGVGITTLLPFGAAGLALFLNARSMFGVTALAAVFAFISRTWRRMSKAAVFGYFLLTIVASVLLVSIYSYSASNGLLGEQAQKKYEQQATGNVGILGGRVEFLASSQAIVDSPIVGHGSWAKDPHYINIMLNRAESEGLPIEGDLSLLYSNPLIPTHSHVLGAWVEAGILGAAFWVYILFLSGKSLSFLLRRSPTYAGLAAFIIISFIWDILFSPFGLDRRVADAALICFIVAIIKEQAHHTG